MAHAPEWTTSALGEDETLIVGSFIASAVFNSVMMLFVLLLLFQLKPLKRVLRLVLFSAQIKMMAFAEAVLFIKVTVK